MLSDARVQPMLPVKDLGKAKKFYEETLGLKKTGEMGEEGLASRYSCYVVQIHFM